MLIAFIGTGSVATSLGRLFYPAGHQLVYGSRQPAPDTDRLRRAIGPGVQVTTPLAAAQQAEVVVLAIPYDALTTVADELREVLQGKLVVDTTNPVQADWSPRVLGAENSAGEETARHLPDSRVVKAFNTIFADRMQPGLQALQGQRLTAFICGDDPGATQTVATLAADAGFAPLIVHGIQNARYVEAMAHLNIQLAVGQGGGTGAGFAYLQA